MLKLNTSDLPSARLSPGEHILLSGTVYTARDAAHKRLTAALKAGQPLPFPLAGAVIYYAGPTGTPPGKIIGSCGPTTACRMDKFAPALYDNGVMATIGKGARSAEVIAAIKRNHAYYFEAIGGAGALAARHITACEVVAYADLGCESIKRLTFKDFPVIVA